MKTKYAVMSRTMHVSGTVNGITTDGTWTMYHDDNKIEIWAIWKKY